ncbi:hypothetical protein [Massilia antarctica]|uniref:hypothetical protein n=1 Tax=Massilia antarctica TaxID=2765360 RepID=UPI0006BB8A4A|nr:hypothetical protein [Massilia sp. H27-R4]MCY0914459.1 hypothetical protein [Massilia sp. H27-R4]
MSNPWCYLLYRYGEETGPPTRDEISAAVQELYQEILPGMTEGDYEEHDAASLRYGYDEGPMYVLEITRHGTARWAEWADQDYEVELCPMREVQSLPQEEAVLLWEQLAAGEPDVVRAYFRRA